MAWAGDGDEDDPNDSGKPRPPKRHQSGPPGAPRPAAPDPHDDGDGDDGDDDEKKDEGPPARYLVLPGNYSGDVWHIAAAMVLDPNLRTVIPSRVGGIFGAVTDQTMQFLAALHVDGRATRVNTVPGDNQGPEPVIANCAAHAIRAQVGNDADPVTGWTFASTSIIAEAIARDGADAVRARLRNAFAAAEADARVTAAVQVVRAHAEADPAGGVLLVNMRRGRRGNHPQHNMTLAILDQIRLRAAAAGLKMVRIGGYQDGNNTPGAAWMNDLDPAVYGPRVDLFRANEREDRTQTSRFWSEMHALQETGAVNGVIGGRSGSLDIAAFMGVRTFCWDIQDAADHEYARLCVARDLMSIGQRAQGNGHNTDPNGTLDQAEIDAWLGRGVIAPHVAPNPAFNRVCRLSQLTGAGSAVNRQALLMRPPVPAAVAEEDDGDGDGDGGGGDDPYDAGDGDGGGGDDGAARRPAGAGGSGLSFGSPAPPGTPSDQQLQAMALRQRFAVPPAAAAATSPQAAPSAMSPAAGAGERVRGRNLSVSVNSTETGVDGNPNSPSYQGKKRTKRSRS